MKINLSLEEKTFLNKFYLESIINKQTFVLPKAFQLSALQCNEKYRMVHEGQHFHFNQDLFKIGDNVHLHGYFQTEKYFKHIESKVRSEFTFKPDIVNTVNDYLKNKFRELLFLSSLGLL